MSTWSLLEGVGILKPDILTVGENIKGLSLDGKCRKDSGTSVSCSVVTGSIALALSQLDQNQRNIVKNTAFIKEALI